MVLDERVAAKRLQLVGLRAPTALGNEAPDAYSTAIASCALGPGSFTIA